MATPELVGAYPRPPALVESSQLVRVEALGRLLAESRRSLRVLETFHPPTYYLPPEAVRQELLVPSSGASFCEWKGVARYFDVVLDGGGPAERRLRRAVWTYPRTHRGLCCFGRLVCGVPGLDGRLLAGW